MHTPTRLLCSLIVAAAVLPVAANAAKGEHKKGAHKAVSFTTADKDNDGVVTEAEYVAALKDSLGEEGAKSKFATLDKDHDGKLTKEEFGPDSGEKKKHKKKGQS
jgi:hypothetical protein